MSLPLPKELENPSVHQSNKQSFEKLKQEHKTQLDLFYMNDKDRDSDQILTDKQYDDIQKNIIKPLGQQETIIKFVDAYNHKSKLTYDQDLHLGAVQGLIIDIDKRIKKLFELSQTELSDTERQQNDEENIEKEAERKQLQNEVAESARIELAPKVVAAWQKLQEISKTSPVNVFAFSLATVHLNQIISQYIDYADAEYDQDQVAIHLRHYLQKLIPINLDKTVALDILKLAKSLSWSSYNDHELSNELVQQGGVLSRIVTDDIELQNHEQISDSEQSKLKQDKQLARCYAMVQFGAKLSLDNKPNYLKLIDSYKSKASHLNNNDSLYENEAKFLTWLFDKLLQNLALYLINYPDPVPGHSHQVLVRAMIEKAYEVATQHDKPAIDRIADVYQTALDASGGHLDQKGDLFNHVLKPLSLKLTNNNFDKAIITNSDELAKVKQAPYYQLKQMELASGGFKNSFSDEKITTHKRLLTNIFELDAGKEIKLGLLNKLFAAVKAIFLESQEVKELKRFDLFEHKTRTSKGLTFKTVVNCAEQHQEELNKITSISCAA